MADRQAAYRWHPLYGRTFTGPKDPRLPYLPRVVVGQIAGWRQVPDERTPVRDLVTAARVYAQAALAVCGTAP